jgi:hypothetical protein
VTAAVWYDGIENMSLNPPPLEITRSHAFSGSFTVEPEFICVAPTATTYEHDAGNSGLNLVESKLVSSNSEGVSPMLWSGC